jgi:hypothetical protein
MKRLLIAILVCFSFAGYAQAHTNIVPDSGFERLKPCYDTAVFVGVGNPQWLYYWQNGNGEGTTDYYMYYYCTPSNTLYGNYPVCTGGNQYPRTGDCFAGICATDRPNRNLNYREYLQTQLLMPLEAGKKYYAGCYVNLGESYKRFSVNNFGLLVTDSIPAYDSSYFFGDWYQWGVIKQTPQVINDTTFNLTDTLGWVLVADTFVAQGGEKWFTIGNFRDDVNSIIIPTNYNSASSDSGSYYFVDDVFLYCIDTACTTVPAIGIKEKIRDNEAVNAYPNPAKNKLTIEFPDFIHTNIIEVKFYNVFGEVSASNIIEQTKSELDTEKLTEGIYYLKFFVNGRVHAIRRIIIIK